MLKGQALSSRGNRTVLMLALLLGGLAAVLTAVYLSKSDQGSGGGTGVTVPVAVAAHDISAGTRIDAGMVSVKSIPEGVVLSGTFQKAEDVVGKVTRVAIVSGEQIVSSRLVGAGEGGQVVQADKLSEAVPLDKAGAQCSIDRCGQRALSVSVAKNTASGGLIRAGDHVDVIAAFQDGSAMTVLEDVEVLAIDDKLEAVVVKDQSGQTSGQDRAVVAQGEQNTDATTATLAVWPDEAQKLAAAEEFAKSGHVTVSESVKNSLGLATTDISCGGSLRLMVRHSGQQGPAGLGPKGTCAILFTQVWGS
ncbi:MAG TPA: Flp pilus assembly protein CpaB [Dehalococcoidia bacterium]|nr:Flp pilus assembly protein CpaB [Dehalococcoidia bacterium]